MPGPIVTLTTDFGLQDSYAAQVKGTICSLHPAAQIFDISHQIPSFDIDFGSWILADAISTFPAGTIHLGIVDPGVGSNRRRLIIEAEVQLRYRVKPQTVYLIGPDNGLFSRVAPLSSRKRVWSVENLSRLSRGVKGVDTVFDGRDLFAPAAAALLGGVAPDDLGPQIKIEDIVELPNELPIQSASQIEGKVVRVDRFGNCATNISGELLGGHEKVRVLVGGIEKILDMYSHYSAIDPAAEGCLINSQGMLEVAGGAGKAPLITKGSSVFVLKNL